MQNRRPSVLIVDDDDVFRGVLSRELGQSGLHVDVRSKGEHVEKVLLQTTYDVVVLDLKMPGMDGIATLERIKDVRPMTEVIILTGHGSVESAVHAVKRGAYDFLTKPCDLDHLETTIRRAARSRAILSENAALRHALDRRGENAPLIGSSAPMKQLGASIRRVAPKNSTVLIRGESGSGKEVVARFLWESSRRSEHPFLILDCGATEEGLVLSELFGHECGAFTGATVRKHGLFELADQGTILIDEIGDAPPSLQSRLLRVLETGACKRLGSEESIHVDVRVLAATHRNLEDLVAEGKFREDLYYRLNVFEIVVPPLRDRPEDIPPLIEHFLARTSAGEVAAVDPTVVSLLQKYSWPGNIRELRNVIERAVILADDGIIRAEHLPGFLVSAPSPWIREVDERPKSLREVERLYLASLLERYKGDRAQVAAVLGISERTLYRKLPPTPKNLEKSAATPDLRL